MQLASESSSTSSSSASRAMRGLEIRLVNEHVVFAYYGHVLIALWRKPHEDVPQWFAAEMAHGKRTIGGSLVHLAVYEPKMTAFSASTLRALAGIAGEYEQELIAGACLLLGKGFMAAALRAMTGAAMMLLRSKLKICVAGNTADCAADLQTVLPGHGLPLTDAAIANALEEMRARFPH